MMSILESIILSRLETFLQLLVQILLIQVDYLTAKPKSVALLFVLQFEDT
jgi:hypothetical protein